MPANKHICHAGGIYREIPGNNGKYYLQPSTFRLVISIIEVTCLNISFLLVYQLNYLSLRYKSHSLNI